MDGEGSNALPPSQHRQGPIANPDIQSLSSRCTQCNEGRGRPRNLVVCIDGTGNEFGSSNTNVVKFLEMVDVKSTNPEQEYHYLRGIGTRPKSKKAKLRDGLDMAFARSLKENVKDAYGWLAKSYQKGTQIYLVGFSRGACQVRVLAAMIYEVGLIKSWRENEIETAYDHYHSSRSEGRKAKQAARAFKKLFSWPDVKVHFVGVWDTVASIGFIEEDMSLTRSSSGEHACRFRQALALDEHRVKFMPEYFHEINSLADQGKFSCTSPDDRKTPNSASEHSDLTVADNCSNSSAKKASDIKEVWFAGSHSDVGGKNKTGRHHLPGNVSLLWMRREAAASGLILKPTDIVWLPDDIDLGVTDLMTTPWRAAEYLPIKHQVSYCGPGKNARRLHRQGPRRIIPGQKVHASVLYAHTYKPKATRGEGLDIPIIQPRLEDTMPDGELWETELFDDTAAEELMASLSSPQGVAPIYLDRLLFMLRFKEGRQCVKNVPGWQDIFLKLMTNHDCATVVRLVAIVAYHEASCDLDPHLNCCVPIPTGISEDILIDGERCLNDILFHHKQRDGPRVVALLRLLTRHRILRERILTEAIIETLGNLLDAIIVGQTERYFVLAMDGLNCLLQCVDTQKTVVEKLGSNPPDSNVSRLSRIMKVDDPRLLTVALRMVLILVRIPEGRGVCSEVKSRIKKLASKKERLIGPLAAEIWLILYDPTDQSQVDIGNAHVRANLASVLFHLARHADREQEILILRNLFGHGAAELSAQHRKLIGLLKTTVDKEKARERTAATMMLLKLSQTPIIRNHFREIKLLDVFVEQLRHKDSALLAAHALTSCLKYPDLEFVKDDNKLPAHIIRMLYEDYFDEAVDRFEGFQIFKELMLHAELREKIKIGGVVEILTNKLKTCEEKATRSGLICLAIFSSCDPNHPWFRELFDKGLEHLNMPAWESQEEGVGILSALAQTEHGVAEISCRVHEIVEILLPAGYLPILRSSSQRTSDKPKCLSEPEAQKQKPRSPSWMMGPAYAMLVLAQDEILRHCIRKTIHYGHVKELHQNGMLVGKRDTTLWDVKTPKRADVIKTLDEMIDAVDSQY